MHKGEMSKHGQMAPLSSGWGVLAGTRKEKEARDFCLFVCFKDDKDLSTLKCQLKRF